MDAKYAKHQVITKIQKNIAIAKDDFKDEIDRSKALEERKTNLTKRLEHMKTVYARAIPELKKARALMMELQPDSMAEIRTFIWPSYAVKTVCKCMFVFVKGTYDVCWKSAKRLMASDPTLFKTLCHFDPETITKKQFKMVKHLLKHAENPNMEQMSNMSFTAANLYTWVLGALKYAEIFRKLKPTMKLIKQLEKEIESTISDFESSMKSIDTLEGNLRFLCDKRREVAKVKSSSAHMKEIINMVEGELEKNDLG